MTGALPSVYIIILNWNGWKDTLECLDSLSKSTYRNFNVVVLDNASSNDSLERIRQWAEANRIPLSEYELAERNAPLKQKTFASANDSGFRNLFLISSKENLGFCGGNNVGMEFSINNGADYLLILNNDTIVEPDFLEPMVQVAEEKSDAGLVGGIICYAESPDTVWYAGGRFNAILENFPEWNKKTISDVKSKLSEPYYETEWIVGCMTLIPPHIYKQFGGYNEKFFIWSEDIELSLRIRRGGYKLYIATCSKIYHKGGMSLGRITPLTHYYASRNRLILKSLYLKGFWKWVWYLWFFASRVVRYTEFAVKGRFDLISAGIDAIKDYFKGKYGKWDKHEG